jgi:chaperonin GroES
MNLEPYKNKILVLQQKVFHEDTTAGGIILPEEVRDKKINEGVVMALGFEVSDNISPGEYVIFDEYSSVVLRREGLEYALITEEDIQAVVRKEQEGV